MKSRTLMRFFRTVILAVTLCALLITGLSFFALSTDAAAWAGGTGTSSNPYKIATAAQFRQLFDFGLGTQSLEATYEKYFRLTGNIDLEGAYLETTTMYGSIDGGGYKVSNFRFGNSLFYNCHELKNIVFENVVSGNMALGLIVEPFMAVQIGAQTYTITTAVDNVTIINSTFTAGKTFGTFLSNITNSNAGVSVKNCRVINTKFNVNYTEDCNIGGIVGEVRISNGYNKVALENNALYSCNFTATKACQLGGIAGYLGFNVGNNYFYTADGGSTRLTSMSQVITIKSNTVAKTNFINKKSGSAASFGGIVGKISCSQNASNAGLPWVISDCSVYGGVFRGTYTDGAVEKTAKMDLGGIIGQVNYASVTVSNCSNGNDFFGGFTVGGIIGKAESLVNYSSVQGGSDSVTWQNTPAFINGVYNRGNIYTAAQGTYTPFQNYPTQNDFIAGAGGIIGYISSRGNENAHVRIENAVNFGNVKGYGKTSVGGIIGYNAVGSTSQTRKMALWAIYNTGYIRTDSSDCTGIGIITGFNDNCRFYTDYDVFCLDTAVSSSGYYNGSTRVTAPNTSHAASKTKAWMQKCDGSDGMNAALNSRFQNLWVSPFWQREDSYPLPADLCKYQIADHDDGGSLYYGSYDYSSIADSGYYGDPMGFHSLGEAVCYAAELEYYGEYFYPNYIIEASDARNEVIFTRDSVCILGFNTNTYTVSNKYVVFENYSGTGARQLCSSNSGGNEAGQPITLSGNKSYYAAYFTSGNSNATGTNPLLKWYPSGSTITLPENPYAYVGFDFSGWKNKRSAAVYQSGTAFTMESNRAVWFTPNWTASTPHSVTYAGGDGATGTAPASGSYIHNTVITLPENTFAKTGYSFAGWSDGTGIYAAGAQYTMPNVNVTLTAVWTAKVTGVILNSGGGTDGSVIAEYNSSALTGYTAATKTGYTLDGYYTKSLGGTLVIGKQGRLVSGVNGYVDANGKWINTANILTLYAHWTPKTTVVTLDKNGGTSNGGITLTYGSSAASGYTAPMRNGYYVSGYQTAASYGITLLNADGSLKGAADGYIDINGLWRYASPTLTLYADWGLENYSICFDENGGSEVSGLSGVDYGSAITLPVPQRTGHTFVGWFERNGSVDGGWGNEFTAETMPDLGSDGDVITLYAKWTDYPTDTALTFRRSCSFHNNLTLNYYIPVSLLSNYDSFYLRVETDTYTGNEKNGTSSRVLYANPENYVSNNGTEYYHFAFSGIAAAEVGNEVRAVMHAEKNGAEYVSPMNVYSVRAYAYNRISQTQDSDFRTLLVDMLNYCAASQLYFGYRTDSLVNAELTVTEQGYATQAAPQLTALTNTTDSTGKIYKKSISFGSTIDAMFILDLEAYGGDMSGLSLKIVYSDASGNPKTTEISSFTYTPAPSSDPGKTSLYSARLTTLAAAQMRETLMVTLLKDGIPVSDTIEYSAETYVSNRLAASDNEQFKALLTAMMKYSDAARAYFNK